MILSPLLFLAISSLSFTQAARFSESKVASAWYAGWHATEGFPVEDVSWDKYTYLTYAFAETTNDVNILSLENSNPEVLPLFVAAAHANGVGALVSVGGWTGSRFWSMAVASAENRTAFVKTLIDFAILYDLDGLDFDWEYPNNQGLGCNTISSNDTANYLEFLKELRADPVGKSLLVTAATAINPFMDADGVPSTDVSEFSEYLDYIAIMNYDIWGSWSATVGPNGALNDTCAAEENQQGSAVHAVKRWTDAGFPRAQLLLGLPAYGHSFAVNSTNAFDGDSLALYAPFNSSVHPAGDAWDDPARVDACGVEQNAGGVINFWGMVAQGYLTEDGNPAEGVPYIFDECSQTPFVYNTTTEVMISFDNARSYEAKGDFIMDNSLAGFAIWEAGGDYNDILLDAVRSKVFSDC